MDTIPSQARRTSGLSPRAFGAEDERDPAVQVRLPQRCAAVGGRPPDPEVGPFHVVQVAREVLHAIGRCSTALAEARATAGVTRAEPRDSTITPVASAPSALRATAPRLWGSVTWSRQTSSGPLRGGELVRVGITIGATRATMPW